MSMPCLLQLCPLSPSLEARLQILFEVCPFHAHRGPDGWLAQHGRDVVAIATGGHIGASDALIGSLPRLGIIAINGVGHDKVNLELAHGLGLSGKRYDETDRSRGAGDRSRQRNRASSSLTCHANRHSVAVIRFPQAGKGSHTGWRWFTFGWGSNDTRRKNAVKRGN